MKKNEKKYASLPFFGLGKVLPFLGSYKNLAVLMVACGLCGSAVDIALPLYQRYALNHFVEGGVLDTIGYFIGI